MADCQILNMQHIGEWCWSRPNDSRKLSTSIPLSLWLSWLRSKLSNCWNRSNCNKVHINCHHATNNWRGYICYNFIQQTETRTTNLAVANRSGIANRSRVANRSGVACSQQLARVMYMLQFHTAEMRTTNLAVANRSGIANRSRVANRSGVACSQQLARVHMLQFHTGNRDENNKLSCR